MDLQSIVELHDEGSYECSREIISRLDDAVDVRRRGRSVVIHSDYYSCIS